MALDPPLLCDDFATSPRLPPLSRLLPQRLSTTTEYRKHEANNGPAAFLVSVRPPALFRVQRGGLVKYDRWAVDIGLDDAMRDGFVFYGPARSESGGVASLTIA